MAEVTEKNVMTLLSKDLFLSETSEPLYRVIKGGNSSILVDSKDAYAKVFQKPTELLVENAFGICVLCAGHGRNHFHFAGNSL
jgi:hypothetical protein